MRSTITSRGQTVIPAAIRQRFSLTPSQRLEWIVEADGSIRVVPVDPSPVKAFRGMGPMVASLRVSWPSARRNVLQAADGFAAAARYLGAAHSS